MRLQPPPTTRAICYFALSATRSLIKCPPRVVRPRHFSSPSDNVRHTAAGGRCTPLFFVPLPLLTFLLPRDPTLSPSVPSSAYKRFKIVRWRTGFRQTLLGLPGNSFLCEGNSPCYETQILFYKGAFCNIESACEWHTRGVHVSSIYGKK